MSTLTTPHRRLLESAVKQARRTATEGARKSLEALAVHEPDPYPHMDEGQRKLRVKLRAQARQLGDGESHTKRGSYEIKHLIEKLAYDQWHRILFSQYLLANDLLISPEHGVAVSLDDCEELAPSLGLKDAWAVAARFAAVELPEIFRADDPAGGVELPVEDRKGLIQLVTGLPVDVFTAGDSLGWCYQFWQADKKDEVNAAGNKIGADELPSVTQLFTEDYMVDFLLDNTLGAWWAGKQLALNPQLSTLNSEEELRRALALPGCPWKYLRFIQGEDGKWTPAAGTFDGWPKTVAALRALDPCMGSGHFVVAMFERLVALRLAEEKLDEAAAVAEVIRDNLFGLEIDPRCTQIGAFNLALAAWRRVGHCKLPAMNLACSGLAPNTKREDWLKLTESAPHLRFQMGALYDLFEKAPVLGSLINPCADKAVTYGEALHELQPLLEKALAQETKDDTAHEMAVTARGLAKAAEILAAQFTLVATNVPYLARGKQEEILRVFSESYHDSAKDDLATTMMDRCTTLCTKGSGTIALVTPQNWFSQDRYADFRAFCIKEIEWSLAASLGAGAFRAITGEVVKPLLIVANRKVPDSAHVFLGRDFSDQDSADAKAEGVRVKDFNRLSQSAQLKNPKHRVDVNDVGSGDRLLKFANYCNGIQTGDGPQFIRMFSEVPAITGEWEFHQTTAEKPAEFEGMRMILFWQNGRGRLVELPNSCVRGKDAWNKSGVLISAMGTLQASRYLGHFFDDNTLAIIPNTSAHLMAIWACCSDPSYNDRVRLIDQALKVRGPLVEIPFDLAHWQKVASEKYPDGLPKPFSSDPTQWLFNGHPAGSDQPLHVAVARLLGYQWPRQTGSSFSDCPALEPDGLETLADDDGIVCLSATKGEAPAAERLRALLAQALGKLDLPALLASAGLKGSKSQTLEDWLRDEFFEQHCALFDNRPFIWHVWDGLKNGFSALVNYHQLTHANLEKLTFSYLGDWIRRQQAAVDAGESGSDARLAAAKQLQTHLKLILEGEPPHDLFVRWKPLSKQAIGWHPDLNDGVRMNIRPFMKGTITTAAPTKKNGEQTKQVSILRKLPNIKWDKDRGKEPQRDKAEFPWFWCAEEPGTDPTPGKEPEGNRWNNVHLTKARKEKA